MVSLLKKIFAFDIEANALYEGVTHIWCIWIEDVLTREKWGFRPDQIEEALKKLSEADVVVGHNIIDYDLQALAKLYPDTIVYKFCVLDTLCLSRYLKPDRIGDSPDYPKTDPRYGPSGHGLKQWGVFLGILKGEYGEQENAWDLFTEEMFLYCEQDVSVTVALYFYLCSVAGFDPQNPPTLKWKIK